MGSTKPNVYDLTPANDYLSLFGVGIFHSGIEVYGMEYGFGAHDYPTSGVFEVEPKACPGYVYRCTVSLGTIDMAPSELGAFMERMAASYRGDRYNLISKNCNHFTDDVCLKLTGKSIPGWVNRLARMGSMWQCLLPETLQASTIRKTPEYYERSEEWSPSRSPCSLLEPLESDDGELDQQLLSISSGEVEFIKETPEREKPVSTQEFISWTPEREKFVSTQEFIEGTPEREKLVSIHELNEGDTGERETSFNPGVSQRRDAREREASFNPGRSRCLKSGSIVFATLDPKCILWGILNCGVCLFLLYRIAFVMGEEIFC